MDKNAVLEDMSTLLKRFAKLIGEFCPGDTPDIGSMIMLLEDLSVAARQSDSDTFFQVVESCRHFVENMTLETMSNTKPLEDALLLLEAIFRHMKKGVEFTFETKDVIEILDSAILTRSAPTLKIPLEKNQVVMPEASPPGTRGKAGTHFQRGYGDPGGLCLRGRRQPGFH